MLTPLIFSHSEKNIIDIKTEIDKYLNFDEVKVKNDIGNLESEINILQRKVERKEKIAIAITPLEVEIKKLESDNMSAYGDISKANFFCSQLDIASNSYERAKIHEECELELNEGNPKKIISQKDKAIRSNEKNIKKLECRIIDIKRKGEMDINEVIIDGNNMCYEGSSFIGLSALKKVIPELQKHYKVTVIFDSVIRKHLNSGDKKIKSEFNNNAYIHIVSTKQYADEKILDLASKNHHIFVISNDRYGDYPDKEVKQNDRLIRYEIIKNRIFINDLDIDMSWRQ